MPNSFRLMSPVLAPQSSVGQGKIEASQRSRPPPEHPILAHNSANDDDDDDDDALFPRVTKFVNLAECE